MYLRNSCAHPANSDLCNLQEVRFYIALHHMYSQDQIVPDDSTPNPSKLHQSFSIPSLYLRPNLKKLL